MSSPHVAFVFASGGIGGAEQSMTRLMRAAHPTHMRCAVAIIGRNDALESSLAGFVAEVVVLRPFDWLGLAQFFHRNLTDVAYLFGQVRTLPWAVAARGAGVRLVVGAERGSATRWINRVGRLLDRFVIDGYIANSRTAGDNLVRQQHLAASRVRVVPNGMALPDGPVPPLPANMTTGGARVVCVANLTPNKGQIVLLRAVRMLQGDFPDLKAWLVGQDVSGGAFFRAAEAEGLADTFEWAGFVRDVRPFLSKATVFCLPTLFREGMPTSILEAMSAGIPVVASDVGGVSNLVDDGINGLLTPPGDVKALAQRLRRLLDDTELSRRLVQGASIRTVPHYSMEAMVTGHLAAFHAFSRS